MMHHHPDPHLKDMEGPRPFVNGFVAKNQEETIAFNNLVNSDEFISAENFRQQVGLICQSLRTDTVNVSFERIAFLWGKHKWSIQDQLRKYIAGPRPNGRPSLLTQQEMQILHNEIERYLNHEGNPTYEYLSVFVQDELKKSISTEALRHMIRNNFP